MANEQNLRPSVYKLSQEEAKKGGIASGKKRKEKADIRKAINSILNDTYTDKQGKKVDGISVIAMNMFKMAADPNNKNAIAAMKLMLDLAGQLKSEEDIKKLQAEIKLIEAKANAVKDIAENEVEDLSPLAKMLMKDEPKDEEN